MGALNTTTNYAYLAGYGNAYVINGAASGPVFSAAPSPLAFGNQTEDTTSAAKTLTVTNTGTTDLTIATVTAGGTNKADFILGSDTCASSTVSAGKTCTISVEFAPSTTAAESATLSFADNASNSPQVVNLTGTGVAPVATASTAHFRPRLTFSCGWRQCDVHSDGHSGFRYADPHWHRHLQRRSNHAWHRHTQ